MREFKNGKYLFGTSKMGERGQIVIPKEAREKFNLTPGDTLLILGDENKNGLAIIKADFMKKFIASILGEMNSTDEDPEEE